MQNIFPSKRSVRLFLRRLYIRANVDRDPRNLHDCLEKPERRGFRKLWLVFLVVPTAYYLYQLRLRPYKTVTELDDTPEEHAVVPKEDFQNILFGPTDKGVPMSKSVKFIALSAKRKPLKEKKKSFESKGNYLDLIMKVKAVGTRNTTTTTKKTTRHIVTRLFLPECITYRNGTGVIGHWALNTSRVQISLDKLYPMVREGGYYKPPGCEPVHRVAIIVPYRNRTKNLSTFLLNIHPFLMNQNLEYRIFVIEQFGKGKFNRGRLFNAGFKEMKKYGQWKCVVFHDVDLLPTNGRILYTCPGFPRHLSSSVVEEGANYNKTSPYLFGGVTSMTLDQFQRCNGYSNMYWGWGGEDYDMFFRLRAAGFPVVRFNRKVAKFVSLSHSYQRPNPLRYRLLRTALMRWQDEGLNTVEYKMVATFTRHLFTQIIVNIDPYGDSDVLKDIGKVGVALLRETEQECKRQPTENFKGMGQSMKINNFPKETYLSWEIKKIVVFIQFVQSCA